MSTDSSLKVRRSYLSAFILTIHIFSSIPPQRVLVTGGAGYIGAFWIVSKGPTLLTLWSVQALTSYTPSKPREGTK